MPSVETESLCDENDGLLFLAAFELGSLNVNVGQEAIEPLRKPPSAAPEEP